MIIDMEMKGIFLPLKCKLFFLHVNMQDKYVNMQAIFVNMQAKSRKYRGIFEEHSPIK